VSNDLCRLVDIKGADPSAAALLIECRGSKPADLQARIFEVTEALRRAQLPLGRNASEPRSLEDFEFKHDAADYNVFWDVRKGLIPIVGAAREAGSHSFRSYLSTCLPACLPALLRRFVMQCCALVQVPVM
jgi:D-lactate dehydrogenase